MKRTYHFFYKLGKIFFIIDILLLVSLFSYSLSSKGKVDYGNRCYVDYEFDHIKSYKLEGIEIVDEELKCNTYVINYKSKLDEESNILFLNDLSRLLYQNDIDCDVSVTIVSINHQIVASIVDSQINYVITEI